MSDPSTHIKPDRPEPVVPKKEPEVVNRTTNPAKVADQLMAGEYLLVGDQYPTGCWLKKKLPVSIAPSIMMRNWKITTGTGKSVYSSVKFRLLPVKPNAGTTALRFF